jgi:nondiscriminating glutamyl-tRNA synthetase
MADEVRVRFSCPPRGLLDVPEARAALFNWLFARRRGGGFILRIEDTDLVRQDPEAERGIYVSLKWLGLEWDEGPVGYGRFSDDGPGDYGPYRQSERLDIYSQRLELLRSKGLAYPCFCSAEQIEAERRAAARKGIPWHYPGKCACLSEQEAERRMLDGAAPAWRFRAEKRDLTWPDRVRGSLGISADQVSDFLIMRASGAPAPGFAAVVDDHMMAITHVIRREQRLMDAAEMIILYKAFGWEPPAFAHLPMITGPDNKRLSKSHGMGSLDDLFQKGFLPEAIINYLALLGWSSPSGREIMDRKDMIGEFSLDRVKKSDAVFDMQKLVWMNGKYMRAMDAQQLLEAARPFLDHAGLLEESRDEQWLIAAFQAVRDKISTLDDAVQEMKIFLLPATEPEPGALEALGEDDARKALDALLAELENCVELSIEAAGEMIKSAGEKTGLTGGPLYMAVRAAVTGRTHGPDLARIMAVLGRDRVIQRVKTALEGRH